MNGSRVRVCDGGAKAKDLWKGYEGILCGDFRCRAHNLLVPAGLTLLFANGCCCVVRITNINKLYI